MHAEQRPAEIHALEPFYEYLRASTPEKHFVDFLENNKDHIDWWYKNGDKNKEDFAVTYEDVNGVTRGFYVDFVIQLKNGVLARRERFLNPTPLLYSLPNNYRGQNVKVKPLNKLF